MAHLGTKVLSGEGYWMSKYLFYGTLLVVLANLCVAAPKPAIVQGPGQWTVEVKFEQPRQLVLPWGGNGPARYWYTILTLRITIVRVDVRGNCVYYRLYIICRVVQVVRLDSYAR